MNHGLGPVIAWARTHHGSGISCCFAENIGKTVKPGIYLLNGSSNNRLMSAYRMVSHDR